MVLPYLRNRLQVQSMRAILCVGEWCRKGILKDKDILAALKGVPDEVKEEEGMEEGWDAIVV
jgi:hypothetical protein